MTGEKEVDTVQREGEGESSYERYRKSLVDLTEEDGSGNCCRRSCKEGINHCIETPRDNSDILRDEMVTPLLPRPSPFLTFLTLPSRWFLSTPSGWVSGVDPTALPGSMSSSSFSQPPPPGRRGSEPRSHFEGAVPYLSLPPQQESPSPCRLGPGLDLHRHGGTPHV